MEREWYKRKLRVLLLPILLLPRFLLLRVLLPPLLLVIEGSKEQEIKVTVSSKTFVLKVKSFFLLTREWEEERKGKRHFDWTKGKIQ